MLRGTTLIFAA